MLLYLEILHLERLEDMMERYMKPYLNGRPQKTELINQRLLNRFKKNFTKLENVAKPSCEKNY